MVLDRETQDPSNVLSCLATARWIQSPARLGDPNRLVTGARGGTRTPGARLRTAALYPLSYAGINALASVSIPDTAGIQLLAEHFGESGSRTGFKPRTICSSHQWLAVNRPAMPDRHSPDTFDRVDKFTDTLIITSASRQGLPSSPASVLPLTLGSPRVAISSSRWSRMRRLVALKNLQGLSSILLVFEPLRDCLPGDLRLALPSFLSLAIG